MILHLIQDLEYGNDFIGFIFDNYVSEEHFVLVTTHAKETHINKEDNGHWRYLDHHNFSELKALAEKADLIVIHGLFVNDVIVWFYLHKKYLKKVSISIWGADIYAHQKIIENKNVSIGARGLDFFRKSIYRKVNRYYTDNVDDFPLLKQWYGAEGTNSEVLYPSSVDKKMLTEIEQCKSKDDGIVRILLGNSATDTNQHLPALKMLSKYSGENINIICPLSYGDAVYGRQVEEYGKSLFGDKFIGVFDFMTPSEYCKMLSTIDIAVFNNNRQQAMGNIAILAYMGCKMFLRNDTTMWSQYVGRYGCKFHSVDDIEELDFIQFTSINEEYQKINHQSFERAWDQEYLLGLWDAAFNGSLALLNKGNVHHKEKK